MLGICCECLKKIADTANRCPHCGATSPFREAPISMWKKLNRYLIKWYKRFDELSSWDLLLIVFLIWITSPLVRIATMQKGYWIWLPLVPFVIFYFWWKQKLKKIDERIKYKEANKRGEQRRKEK